MWCPLWQREAHLAADVEATYEGTLDLTFEFKTTFDPADPSKPATSAVFFSANAEDDGLIEVRKQMLFIDVMLSLLTLSALRGGGGGGGGHLHTSVHPCPTTCKMAPKRRIAPCYISTTKWRHACKT